VCKTLIELKEGLSSVIRSIESQLCFFRILPIKPWAYALYVLFWTSLSLAVKWSYLSQIAEKGKRIIPNSRCHMDDLMMSCTFLTLSDTDDWWIWCYSFLP
jgi:hypothetical protein